MSGDLRAGCVRAMCSLRWCQRECVRSPRMERPRRPVGHGSVRERGAPPVSGVHTGPREPRSAMIGVLLRMGPVCSVITVRRSRSVSW